MKKELWLRLREYQFDNLVPPHLLDHVGAMFGRHDPSTRAFAAKLARKLQWPTGFALRAIEEYKKFVYLGVTADFHVTPSKAIDQVWHEHLLFSKPYREFCRDVLGRDFDHHPELVPTDTGTSVFSGQYEGTLRLYVSEFNTIPPAEIWGTPKFPLSQFLRPRPPRHADSSVSAGSDGPLYMAFAGHDGSSGGGMPEFGGGGGGSGGGGSSSWGDSSDSTGSDSSSDGGGDSGGGGSSCSSSCGGGGCGGGGD